jgi:acetylornithine deacetylase/succinyl-diaminopimelate desuccinylase-like protein
VPDEAEFHVDRRLTAGETRESALEEIEAALAEAGVQADIYTLTYDEKAWTGLVYPMDKYYPTWILPEDHPALAAARRAGRQVTGSDPEFSRWNFSTNGVTIMGLHGVPCLGFGPGQEELAHMANEWVPVQDVTTACAFYAALAGQLAARPD